MKNITLRITGKQFIGNENEESIEFVTDGKLFEKNGASYIVYEDSGLSGMPECLTTIKLTDGHIRLKRVGTVGTGFQSEMVFNKGERLRNSFRTPFGNFNMEVFTNRVKTDLAEDGTGSAEIDFEVSLEGLGEGRNLLLIDFTDSDAGETRQA